MSVFIECFYLGPEEEGEGEEAAAELTKSSLGD